MGTIRGKANTGAVAPKTSARLFWLFPIKATSVTVFIALSGTYFLCIAGDLLFGWMMYEVWAPLLPGFEWPLTFSGLTIGLLWLAGYSIYTTAILLVPYYLLTRKDIKGLTAPENIHEDEGAR